MIAKTDFIHFDIEATAGDVFADDHPLVVLAPHLFLTEDPPVEPVRAVNREGA